MQELVEARQLDRLDELELEVQEGLDPKGARIGGVEEVVQLIARGPREMTFRGGFLR